jgi:imidazolonepropionase-like amidohydrolase
MIRVILIVILSISVLSCNRFNPDDYKLIIQNVQLFNGDSLYQSATILVQDSAIKKIILRPTSLSGSNVIDGTGKTLLPGLINAHVHAQAVEHLKEAAETGVLTLLDLFTTDPKRADSLRNLGFHRADLAYYYSAGPTVTVPGAHGSQFGPVPLVDSVEEVPQFVEDRVNEGSDYIKLIIESGPDSEWPTLTDEMIRLAIKQSHELNKLAVAHISKRKDALKAVEYDIDGLVHIWRRDTTYITQQQIDLLKNRNAFIVPTLLVTDSVKARWEKSLDIDVLMHDVLAIHEAGIPILAGTDPPNFGLNYGTSLFDEMELLVNAGLSELEVLKSATSNVAKSFQLDHGYIKEGVSADIVLIDGNPIADIKHIRKVYKVFKFGDEIIPVNKP